MFFATDKDIWLLGKLRKEEEEIYNKFGLQHYFNQFSFGDLT